MKQYPRDRTDQKERKEEKLATQGQRKKEREVTKDKAQRPNLARVLRTCWECRRSKPHSGANCSGQELAT
jgi:hypothetical protein